MKYGNVSRRDSGKTKGSGAHAPYINVVKIWALAAVAVGDMCGGRLWRKRTRKSAWYRGFRGHGVAWRKKEKKEEIWAWR